MRKTISIAAVLMVAATWLFAGLELNPGLTV